MGNMESVAKPRLSFPPLLPVLMGITGGIILYKYFSNIIFPYILIIASVSAILIILRKTLSPISLINYNRYNIHRWSILFTTILIGYGDALLLNIPKEEKIPEFMGTTVSGVIQTCVNSANGDRLLIEINEAKTPHGKVYSYNHRKCLITTDGAGIFKPGDNIIFISDLTPVDKYKTISNHTYLSYLQNHKIFWQGKCKGNDIIIQSESKSPKFWPIFIRDKISDKLYNSSLSKESKSFVFSILLGDKSMLTSEVKDNFRKAGLSHLLAVSGLHIGIIYAIFITLFIPFNFFSRLWKYILIIIFIWIFIFITGMPPSAVRAGIMVTFVCFGKILQRNNIALNALCAAAILILIFDPTAIFDIGFQLSFICVGALLLFLYPLDNFLNKRPYLLKKLLEIILVSIVCVASSWALTTYYFNDLPILFIPANLLILPFIPFYLIISIFYLSFLFLGIDINLLSSIINILTSLFIKITLIISNLDWATISVAIHWSVALFWIIFISTIAYALYSRKRIIIKIIPLIISGGLFLIFLLTPSLTIKTNYTILDEYKNIRISCTNPKTNDIIFPRKKNSYYSIDNKKIICIDSEKLYTFIPCDYLIIGGNFKGNITELVKRINPKYLIFHPSVYPQKAIELKAESYLPEKRIHDIREDGIFLFN